MTKKDVFNNLNHINVNKHTERKKNLTYLSWAWAWAEVKKEYPEATYKIERFGENKKPYLYDEGLGYMVFTKVTIEGLTHEMWLPVMDHNNLAMKSEPYEKKFKNSTAKVDAATMFDINSTIMRCLTKNLAMHGLGLYIYAGEDLPQEPPAKKVTSTQISGMKAVLKTIAELTNQTETQATKALLAHQGLPSKLDQLDENQYGTFLIYLNDLKQAYEKKAKAKQEEVKQESLLEGNTTKVKSKE